MLDQPLLPPSPRAYVAFASGIKAQVVAVAFNVVGPLKVIPLEVTEKLLLKPSPVLVLLVELLQVKPLSTLITKSSMLIVKEI